MLGKYIKHEFKETGKLMIPLNLVIIVFTLFGALFLGSRLFENPTMALMAIICLMLYIFSLIAIFIVAYVYFTVRFYKSMYASQGYLTHTLPLSTGSVLNTKVLVSLFWILVTVLFTFLSVAALIFTAFRQEWGKMFVDIDVSLVQDSLIGFLIPYFFLLLVGCLEQILMIYASLSIGQLFRQYRILASVGMFFAFYAVIQILGTVTMFITNFFSVNTLFLTPQSGENTFFSFYRHIFSISAIESILLCVIFYIVCYWLTNKKLNLE